MKLKEQLDKLGLNIEFPEVILNYDLFLSDGYTSQSTETINGKEYLVLTGTNSNNQKIECILNPYKQRADEFLIENDGTRTILSSIDSEGNIPLY